MSRKTTTTNGQNPAVRAFFPLTMVRSLVLSGILQTHPTIKIHKQRLFRGVDRASKQRAGRPVSKLAQRTSPSTRTDLEAPGVQRPEVTARICTMNLTIQGYGSLGNTIESAIAAPKNLHHRFCAAQSTSPSISSEIRTSHNEPHPERRPITVRCWRRVGLFF